MAWILANNNSNSKIPANNIKNNSKDLRTTTAITDLAVVDVVGRNLAVDFDDVGRVLAVAVDVVAVVAVVAVFAIVAVVAVFAVVGVVAS